ncbi:MFS transporter [Agrobacterium tumefaciens]|uniref:MFS transporter n=1 Tax=Agrobacterium tumefaciens TaxID=358 RepID=UPI0022432BD1|nr:MFS transporter [Agrobacterium tumefaciens]MCW8060838.1 MFS transporter [Agrobacterium tumefaciens]
MEHTESTALKGTDRRVMATLALSMLLASLGTSIANIALPTLAEAFSAPFHHVQWVVIAYLAAMTVSVVFVGRLGDRYGLRRMHIAGLVLFCITSLLCGLASNLWLLVGTRALQGIGAAFLMTLTIALARETASEERMGRAMGLLGTVSALGTALGPSLGGVLLSVTGWPGIFHVQVPIALLALILALSSLPPDVGSTMQQSAGPRAVRKRITGLLPNLSVNILVAAVMMTTLVVGPFYLGFGLGLTEMRVGIVMSIGPLISIFSGVPSGHAVDTWGARRVLTVGLIMLAVGAFLLSFLPALFGTVGYVLAITVLTPGYQLFQAGNNTAVMANVPKDRRGSVSGLLNLSRNIGLILGASVMGGIFALGVGTSDVEQALPAAITSGMRLVFILAGGMMLAAIWIALRRSNGTA